MKYVSMRMPEPGPLGETFFEASVLAIVAAGFVNNPSGGWVESVCTRAIHLLEVAVFLRGPGIFLLAIVLSHDLPLRCIPKAVR